MLGAGVAAAVVVLLASADVISLPTPDAAQVQSAKLITAVGGRPDRLLSSDVPGPVVNDELVRVGLAGDGGVQQVLVDQRLRLTGQGDYAIRERGPARSASSLGDEPPPVTRRGAVVWQGFSPGSRDLAARLALDAQLEATRLPLAVSVSFEGHPLAPGGWIPGAGRVTITLTNTTAQPQVLPTASDAPAREVARWLDRARVVRSTGARLPATGAGLPRTLPVTGAAERQAEQAVPLLLTGAVRLVGTAGAVSGPGTTATSSGARLRGTLGGSLAGHTRASVSFTVRADGPGSLVLDLTAVPALNPLELNPPAPFPTWAAWAASGPGRPARQRALDLLVAVAATGARASAYSPYLGADLQGTGSTAFRYGFAPAPKAAAAERLHPRWGAIALAGLALLLIITNAALIWRRF